MWLIHSFSILHSNNNTTGINYNGKWRFNEFRSVVFVIKLVIHIFHLRCIKNKANTTDDNNNKTALDTRMNAVAFVQRIKLVISAFPNVCLNQHTTTTTKNVALLFHHFRSFRYFSLLAADILTAFRIHLYLLSGQDKQHQQQTSKQKKNLNGEQSILLYRLS